MSGQRQIKDVPSSALQLSIAWIFFFFLNEKAGHLYNIFK